MILAQKKRSLSPLFALKSCLVCKTLACRFCGVSIFSPGSLLFFLTRGDEALICSSLLLAICPHAGHKSFPVLGSRNLVVCKPFERSSHLVVSWCISFKKFVKSLIILQRYDVFFVLFISETLNFTKCFTEFFILNYTYIYE